jgi:hypothetical protein
MIDINTGLKSDTDESSNKFIIVTDKEEARKAIIVKRFGGNTKGAAIGSSGASSFLSTLYPFIVESNGFIHITSQLFLEDVVQQASFFRHIPWSTNTLQSFLSTLSISLQSALSGAIITHNSCLNPPPPSPSYPL